MERPDLILNKQPYRGARILVADRNFGGGSSREQAVWALADYLLGVAGASLAAARRAGAAEWPSRPIRIVVPHAAGGGNDTIARIVAEALQPILGQPVVVENRTGANGVVGADAVARGSPDRHLFLMIARTHVMNRHAMGSPPFHPVKDFAPVTMLARFPLVLVANADAPFRDVRQLIAHAKANPGTVGFGISEAFVHYASASFARMAGVSVLEVPYRGSSLILNDLVAGHVPVGWVSPPSMVPHLQEGWLRPLGVTTTTRTRLLPDVPPIAEAGLPGYECAGLYGIVGPAGLPHEIAAKMHGAIERVIAETFPGDEMAPWTGVFAPADTPPAAMERFSRAMRVALADAEVRRRPRRPGPNPWSPTRPPAPR